jgi:protein involved in ribonucleotide reduction
MNERLKGAVKLIRDTLEEIDNRREYAYNAKPSPELSAKSLAASESRAAMKQVEDFLNDAEEINKVRSFLSLGDKYWGK